MRWSVGERVVYLWKHAGELLFGLGVALVGTLIVLLVVPSQAMAFAGGAAMIMLLGLIAWYFKRAGDKLEIEHSSSVGAFTQDLMRPQTRLMDDDLG
jgi:hypothetical protein